MNRRFPHDLSAYIIFFVTRTCFTSFLQLFHPHFENYYNGKAHVILHAILSMPYAHFPLLMRANQQQ